MSQQGGRPTGPEDDDWWGQLYDDSTDDTGPTAAPDSLDDRFASASGTVGRRPDPGTRDATSPPPPGPAAERKPAPAEPRPWWAQATPPGVPGARTEGPPHTDEAPRGSTPLRPPGPPSPRAPWEPPPTAPPGPVSFPPGPDRSSTRPIGTQPSASQPPASPTRQPSASQPPASPTPQPPPPQPPAPPTPQPSAPQPPARPAPQPSVTRPPAPPTPQPSVTQPPAPPTTPPPATAPPDDVRPGSGGAARHVGPRGDGLRGRTTSGTGDADLSEPPAVVPLSRRPVPPRSVADLPPPPSSFLPSLPAEPDGADRDYVGTGPPTYDAEPVALPPADPDGLDGLVPDTVLDGARYGTCTLRAVSVRGDSARYRGEPRRDALLVARFGAGEQALVLVAMATGARATPGAHRAAAEVCRWIGRAVGRSQARLAEDLRAARRGELKSGLHRLTDRSLGRLRADAAEQGLAPDEYAATLRCLLLPADPECRTRVFFGVGAGGLLRLRDGAWQDMEPDAADVTGEPVLGFGSVPRGTPRGTPGGTPHDAPSETPDGDRLTMDLGITTAPGPYDGPPAEPPREPFRFRASVARPGDVLLMCTAGLAEPLLNEPELGELLARRWTGRTPPGLAEFLTDSRVRVKGYADDRTAAAVWEA